MAGMAGEQVAANCRRYGGAPYRVAVVHGGPGAAGEMAPVASELGQWCGVLEPLQTADSIEGQIEELATACRRFGTPPCTLIGHSWGAWLALLTAAAHPDLVGRLVLVGSGPLRAADAARIMETRLARLTPQEQTRLCDVLTALHAPDPPGDRDALFTALGALMSRADDVDPLPPEPGPAVACQERIFQAVWSQAEAWRKDGKLLEAARNLRCPVLAIHGLDDPHPLAGVEEPLASLVTDFRMSPLPACGHTPWRERQARNEFFNILRQELTQERP